MEIIRKENIRVNVEVIDWEDALRKAGDILVENGSIKKGYIENMINSVKEYGPYIVLMPGFALGHSEPCPEVIKTDISLITLANAVNFNSNNDPVKVVMCLGCVDKESHISKIQAIAMKLMSEGIIEQMVACKDATALYNLINE